MYRGVIVPVFSINNKHSFVLTLVLSSALLAYNILNELFPSGFPVLDDGTIDCGPLKTDFWAKLHMESKSS